MKAAFQSTGPGPNPLETELSNLLKDAYKLTGRAEFEEARKGIESGTTTVEQASRLVADTKAVATRAGFWWRLLIAAKLPNTPQFWVWSWPWWRFPSSSSLSKRGSTSRSGGRPSSYRP